MNLVTMRERFTEHVSDLASDLSTSSVDEYLQRAYLYVIPMDVGGEFSEQVWSLFLLTGQDTYEYARYVVSVTTESAWIDQGGETNPALSIPRTFLNVYTNRTVFEIYGNQELASPARPTSVLFYGRELIVSPTPDMNYILKVPIRGGPTVGLTSTGIENNVHAMAVVTAAASEFLIESEDEAGVNRESALYQSYLKRLHVMAHGRPNKRRRARSY